ncbi:IclR family transcriptional regulator [Gracilibacillus alcaliphilus]|uniref:IclR family transcriptional regulator n=1 Tax=Gracilibacillus alcaliphilus TaxID=1401441 RepID=UPI0019595A61|nr:IclR family transcriptional regulator [Gracilibacillus alcaliphilus]MBM7679705.1 DNA-binding IclR family transcriptional regulator [Gracilibacillus alcaliphilus]
MAQVQSLERSLSIMEYLARDPAGASVAQLSQEMGLAKSTVHRLLQTLMARGYVQQDQQYGHYQLGVQCLTLASHFLGQLDIRNLAKASLMQLSKDSGEVVHLCILDRNEAVYIDKVESQQTLRMYSQVGRRAMLHCTGVGKALLVGFDEQQVERLIQEKGLPRFTDTTITEAKQLEDEIKQIRQQGYAIDEQEHEKGIRCIAAPIFDYEGKVSAAISIAGPIERMTKERVQKDLPSVMLQHSQLLSKKLGYRGCSKSTQMISGESLR